MKKILYSSLLMLLFCSTAYSQLNEGQKFLTSYNTSSTGKQPLENGNKAGTFGFKGWTGAPKYKLGAALTTRVSGDVSSDVLPLDFIIQTGAIQLEDRMNVLSNGNVGFNFQFPESRVVIKQYVDTAYPNRNPFEVIGGNDDISAKRFRLYNDNGLLNGSLDGQFDVNEGDVNVNDGSLFIKKGDMDIDEGNILVGIGDAIFKAGDVLIQQGHLSMSKGDISVGKGDVFIDEGKLVIGTTNSAGNDKIKVGGTVRCTEVMVELESDWPDYVFSNTYQLLPLNELKERIYELNHLPGVPSEADVKNDGMGIGEMQRILLEKIEELTLYTIQQQEEIENLREEIRKIK